MSRYYPHLNITVLILINLSVNNSLASILQVYLQPRGFLIKSRKILSYCSWLLYLSGVALPIILTCSSRVPVDGSPTISFRPLTYVIISYYISRAYFSPSPSFLFPLNSSLFSSSRFLPVTKRPEYTHLIPTFSPSGISTF